MEDTRGEAETQAPQAPRLPWWVPAMLVLAGLVAWHNSFEVPLLYDDLGSIRDNPSIRDLSDWGAIFATRESASVSGRPLLNLSLALNYAVGGTRVFGYHLVNLLLHVASAWILAALALRTLIAGTAGTAGGAARGTAGADLASLRPHAVGLAFAIALLWLVHPMHTQSVTYIVQRGESLMGLWFFATLFCAAQGFFAPRSKAWFAASVLCCLAGVATKEAIVSAPVVVLVYDRVFASGSFLQALRRHLGLYAGYVLSWGALWLLLTRGARSVTGHFTVADNTIGDYLLTQAEVIPTYLKLCVWPAPLIFDHAWPIRTELLPVLLPGLLVLALLGVSTVGVWRGRGWGFLGWGFFLALAPTSSFMPIFTEAMAERRLYVALAPVVAAVVLGLWLLLTGPMKRHTRELSPGTVGSAALALAVVAASFATIRRNEVYQTRLSLWLDTAAQAPHNANALAAAGMLLIEADRGVEAVPYLEEAGRLEPERIEHRFNLGNLHLRLSHPERALASFERGLSVEPGNADLLKGAAAALEALGRDEEALEHYQAALAAGSEDVTLLARIAAHLERSGRGEEALAHRRRAAELRPGDARFEAELAYALLRSGRVEEALVPLRASLEAQPSYREGLILARILASHPAGNVRDGEEALRWARSIAGQGGGEDPAVLDVLAMALAETGSFEEALEQAARAAELARARGEEERRLAIEARLAGYRASRPFRQAFRLDQP